MECLLLYLDDLEDIVYAVALAAERIRRFLAQTIAFALIGAVQVGLVVLAIRIPAMGAAVAALLGVAALYRSAAGPARPLSQRA